MIGQSPVPTNKGKGMRFERKQPFVGREALRNVTSLKTAAKETNTGYDRHIFVV